MEYNVDLFVATGQFILWVIIGAVLGFIIGKLVNIVLDRTVEKWIDKTGLGKEIREVGLDFSDIMGLFIGAIVFLLALQIGLGYLPTVSATWEIFLRGIAYTVNIVIALSFITAGLLFIVWFVEYIERFVKRYREDIALLIKALLGIGLLWVVITFALHLLKLEYTIFQNLLLGFVVIAFGVVIIDLISEKIGKVENLKPYLLYFLYSIFALVAINAIFSEYIPVNILDIFAYGFVALFVLSLLPAIVKAIKEAY